MGAHPYWYFVPYEQDLDAALQKLRLREFQAGRYNPAMHFINFPVDPSKPSSGPRHSSIDQARQAADADGTRSILDIDAIGDGPDFCTAAPLDDSVLQNLYQTAQPTRQMIESNMDFLEDVERGQAIYIVVYKNNHPDELFFAVYSFD